MSFDPSGDARCVYTDAIELQSIGALTIERASCVEFNAQKQIWEVRLATCPDSIAFSDVSRKRCIEWEIAILETTLLT